MSAYTASILANYDNDHHAAYEHLAKLYQALERQHMAQIRSRFFEISRSSQHSEICLRQVTEEQISDSVDMADCEPEFVMLKRFYVDDSGEIHPVTIGRQERFSNGVDQPFHFAASAIIANGKQVGEVVFTDH